MKFQGRPVDNNVTPALIFEVCLEKSPRILPKLETFIASHLIFLAPVDHAAIGNVAAKLIFRNITIPNLRLRRRLHIYVKDIPVVVWTGVVFNGDYADCDHGQSRQSVPDLSEYDPFCHLICT